MITGVMFLIGMLGIAFSWWTLFSLVTSKSRIQISLLVSVIILLLSPVIFEFSSNLFAQINRDLFSINESGEMQLNVTPMRIPADYKSNNYCARFTDENGNPITEISTREDGTYCGEYWKFYKQNTIFIPFQKLPDGKAKYWVAPGKIIIGEFKYQVQRR